EESPFLESTDLARQRRFLAMRSIIVPGAPVRHEPDIATLEDEHLVALAVERDCRLAPDELIGRYLPLMERLVRRRGARISLQVADHEDVQQEAILWIVEAIRRYRTSEQLKPCGCHFRSFLHCVLDSRLTDFLRRRQRLRSHFPLEVDISSRHLR